MHSRAHYDQALAIYDPAQHRSLSNRFGQDIRAVNLVVKAHGRCGYLAIPKPRWQTWIKALTMPMNWSRCDDYVCTGYNLVFTLILLRGLRG